MAIYDQGKFAGVVGYKQLYPNGKIYPLEELLTELPRQNAIKLVLNIQKKLVGKPFYNPDFKDEKTTQIDVPRFFFGLENSDWIIDTIHRYKNYLARVTQMQQPPMKYATGSETPLLLLKYIMALPPSNVIGNISQIEKRLYTAFLIANDITFNRDQGDLQGIQEDDLELNLSSFLMSQFAYSDFTHQESDLNDLLRNQSIRTKKFFNFISQHPQLKGIYDKFLEVYELTSWKDYMNTYWNIVTLAKHETGVVHFEQLKNKEQLLSEHIVDKDSIDIGDVIPLEANVDYQSFREKPFIKIAPHEYAIIDVSFVICRMYDGLYFMFNDLWQCLNPDNKQEFNRIFTTEFSEGTLLVNCLKEVSMTQEWVSLTDHECKAVVPEHKLNSSPDFYIRDEKDIILFECKDVKIPKEVKAEGSIQQLLEEVNKRFVGYEDPKKKKWRFNGVGQLLRNAKRIQNGEFLWDKEVDKNSRIFPVLVLADAKQITAGWKNYLNRKMFEECARQNIDCNKVSPLILLDLGTLLLYEKNFKEYGFLRYFTNYYEETTFNPSTLFEGDIMTNILNQTMSFGVYMNSESLLGGEEFKKDVIDTISKRSK